MRAQNVFLHIVDMAQPRQVVKFARDFATSGQQLHVLVNNAGCMVNERQTVEGDLEANFATNTLGTHILTKTLIPILAKAEKPRIVSCNWQMSAFNLFIKLYNIR